MDPHFSDAALRFLRSLKRHNNRDWFNERKQVYETELKAPLLALIAALNDRMVDFAPAHIKPPAKIMLRIYRDTRFSPNKLPYKTHISAWWGVSGMHKTSGAGFYFDLSGTAITVAAGLFMPERDQLLAERRFLLDHGEAVRTELSRRRLTRLGLAVIPGQPLSRPPKGFLAEHPADDLIRCREWGVSAELPTEVALSAKLAGELDRRFRASAALVHLLNQPLAGTQRAPRPMISPLPF